MNVCAVIPAAGIGSRLGAKIPKLLLPLTHSETVWSVLRNKLLPVVDHIHIIASPQGEPLIRQATQADEAAGLVSMSIQPKPLGMGDAIFQGHSVWSQASSILIIWGDQVFVSPQTLTRSLAAHAGAEKTIALPLTQVTAPYVEYIFNNDSRLVEIKQSREGDACSATGLADVGTFILSVTELLPAWQTYSNTAAQGSRTGEINFLPFLPFLAASGWRVQPVKIKDATEARGINTPDDLGFFQNLFDRENII